VGSGEGVGTGVCSGATGGVITNGDAGVGSGEGEVTTSGEGGEAGAGLDGPGVQPAESNTSTTKRPAVTFILMPNVQNLSTGIIVHPSWQYKLPVLLGT